MSAVLKGFTLAIDQGDGEGEAAESTGRSVCCSCGLAMGDRLESSRVNKKPGSCGQDGRGSWGLVIMEIATWRLILNSSRHTGI